MNQKNSFFSMEQEKFNRLAAVSIAVITVLVAILTYLQGDASARDDQANRDSKRYSLEAFGRQVSGDARANFDYNVAYQMLYELETLAQSAEERGDEAAAARYREIAEGALAFSPLLADPYYDPAGEAEPDIARYEVDTYLVEIVTLREKFLAASVVKDAWDKKANTYIVHLTLLAVALFLFGLATTISSARTRWVFAGVGSLVAVAAVLWAFALWASPVFDLRQQGSAIDDYARGYGLAYQENYEAAVSAFDAAIQAHSGYAAAYAARANAYTNLGDYEQSAADYEAAQENGDKSANTAGELAWIYYLLGDFESAIEMNRTALVASPDELWIQFDLALSLLASGQTDAAKAEYQKGMDSAAAQVAAAKAAGAEPPSWLWWSLGDAGDSLEDLLWTLESGEGEPAPEDIADPAAVTEIGGALMIQIKSLATALEYTGLPPAGAVSASIGEFQFAVPVLGDDGEIIETEEPAESFIYGLDEIAVLFDFSGMQDGQEVLFKLYIDGEEDPSWRLLFPWELGAAGSSYQLFSYAYSDTFVFAPGEYRVEMYINNHLVQWGYFTVEE